MTTLIRRRIDGFHPKSNSEIILRTNKSKNLNWWRVLNTKKSVTTSTASTTLSCVPVCDQIRLDVERAFWFNTGFPKVDIVEKREKLYKIIISVFARNPTFKYYQGFHEICSLFLVVFVDDDEKCILAVEKFSREYLSMFLDESFDKILKQYTWETLNIASNYTYELGKIRASSSYEKEQFNNLISGIKEVVEPHGLIASWFLTWFVHEFPNFEDSLKVFDFQLTEISTPNAPIYIASSLLILYKKRMIEWKDEPFELIMFLRNLPKIASSTEVIDCCRSLKRRSNNRYDRLAWMTLIVLHFIYYILSITILPKLKEI